MKRKVSNVSLFASSCLLAFGALGMASCTSNKSAFSAAQVILDASVLNVEVGKVARLKVSVSRGYSGSVRFFTNNEGIADVDDQGYVYGISAGQATITASYGGGYAECIVTVTDGGGSQEVDKLYISPSSKTIGENQSFTITHNVYPRDTAVTYSIDDPSVASISTITGGVQVTGLKAGSAVITASATAIGKVATCSLTVTSGEIPSEFDIAVDKNLGYTGTLIYGRPDKQADLYAELCADFNRLTNSSINFVPVKFEEDNGISGYGKAEEMPAIFPYASDQTLDLYQFKALNPVNKVDKKWISDNMGANAVAAAKLGSNLVGYPFSADNGFVMYYDKSVITDPSQIDTIDKLFAVAGDEYEVNYNIFNGFYGVSALMTYTEGVNLYEMTPSTSGYSVKSSFDSEVGIQGAKLVHKIANEEQLRSAKDAPNASLNGVIATIIDTSNVTDFKKSMGSKYAVAPLPYIDDTKTTRLGSYLGYKFYGVNQTLNDSDKTHAEAFAKFLCSEYSQMKRYDAVFTKPTLSSLNDFVKDEPHIAALIEQENCKSTIPLLACGQEIWSESPNILKRIKELPDNASNAQYQTILAEFDLLCRPK